MQLEKFKVSMESAVAKQLKCAEQAQRDTCYLLVIHTLRRKVVEVHRIDATVWFVPHAQQYPVAM